jgi:hypothetical protein
MKRALVILSTAALIALFALPALSELRAISHPTGEMIIGDQVVLTIHSADGGMTIQQRVDVITTRLNKRLGSADFDPALINVRKFGNEYSIMYRNDLIVTSDTKTAEMNGTTTEKLANKWAANLRRVLPLAKAEPHRR